MSAEAVIGILVVIALGLVGIIYGLLRGEDQRLARNIHDLRNLVNAIVLTLAGKGIKIPKDKDE